jgi:hypothetical protein
VDLRGSLVVDAVRSIGARRRADGEVGYEVLLDGDVVDTTDSEGETIARLLGLLNATVMIGNSRAVVHAGAVALVDTGVLMPGASNAGKSTLTAGLVRAGFGYLSEEAVAFEPGSSVMLPYPRPLTISEAGLALFPEIDLDAPGVVGPWEGDWFVPASVLRPGSVHGPAAVRVVVFPRYDPTARTELVPLGRAEAVRDLIANTIEYRDRMRMLLDHYATIINGCECYRLTTNDLGEAVDAVRSLVGAPA